MESPTNQAEALKARTKQFALRIIRLIRSLPRSSEGRIIGNSCYDQACQWQPTIVPYAALALGQSFYRNLPSKSKRPMNRLSGLNSWSMPASFQKQRGRI